MSNERSKISSLNGGLLWVGAAISIAEILTGALLAPLGFFKGFIAILLGHFIGCVLFFLVGYIGAKEKKSAMDCVVAPFGPLGKIFFSALNALQLLGWTAVMLLSGAQALSNVYPLEKMGQTIWILFIGILILAWVILGLKNLGKLNTIAVFILAGLMIMLGSIVFRKPLTGTPTEALSFGLALELSIAMPISWLPLIADFTRYTDKPIRFTFVSTLAYFAGSVSMYVLGLGAALSSGSGDISMILMKAGLGVPAVAIIILSTVTTTFLDVHSAGVCFGALHPRIDEKKASILACLGGMGIGAFVPLTAYEGFLYFISSVFVPMAAILVTDYFLLAKGENHVKTSSEHLRNGVVWLSGFLLYQVLIKHPTPVGSTIPVVAAMIITSLAAHEIFSPGPIRIENETKVS